ncbi:hypothetical protein TRIATDRAFT_217277 [Trichoderma atroviride IMI 206040]|uniref:DUF7165 domain-containing protein n=3 Tax=Hypocrea atroviridis TaxID=63577 RepID=G9NQU1_HYPAI|nr:uncharacterized protein TRIATDRAFT_217277 [Trichoderma atroviride IMI 206040]EHK46911.1 hypothetical protein TRIATDRAFT_217277 [Trichoderma atroviride IMI 206040]
MQVGQLVGSGQVACIRVSLGQRRIAVVGESECVAIYHSETYKITQVVRATEALCVSFPPSASFFAVGSYDGMIHLWQLCDSELEGVTPLETLGIEAMIKHLALSPDKQLLAAAHDGGIGLFGATEGRLKRKLSIKTDGILHLSFSPDSQMLLVSGTNNVGLYSVHDGSLVRNLEGQGDWVRQSAFSPNGQFVASASDDRRVRIWDTQKDTTEPEVTLQGHLDYVRCVAFSPDGKLLATGGDDYKVRVWDLTTEKESVTLGRRSSYVYNVAFSPDSKRILASCSDKSVRIWDWETETALKEMKNEYEWRNLRFDIRLPDYIITDLGAQYIGNHGPSNELPNWASYSMEYDDADETTGACWITWQGARAFQLPEAFRPTASYFDESRVIIGTETGRILQFKFHPDIKPSLGQ